MTLYGYGCSLIQKNFIPSSVEQIVYCFSLLQHCLLLAFQKVFEAKATTHVSETLFQLAHSSTTWAMHVFLWSYIVVVFFILVSSQRQTSNKILHMDLLVFSMFIHIHSFFIVKTLYV